MVFRGAAAAARPAPSRHFAPSGEAEGVGTATAAPPRLAPLREAPSTGRTGGLALLTPRPGAFGRRKAEVGGEAGARARDGPGEDGGGYSSRHTRGPSSTKSFPEDTCLRSFPK
nr:uncharacterized protein LOC109674609 isoform X2 [Castor canadensis]